MKKYLNILVSVSIAFPAFVSFQAVADEPQQIPRIVVRPGPNPSDGVLTGVGLGTPVVTLPPIEVRPRPENPDGDENAATKPSIDEKLTSVIKQAKDLCNKSSEDCGSWGSRMTAPQPAGSGFCTNISAAYPLIGTSLCIQVVNREVNLNSCANVGCP